MEFQHELIIPNEGLPFKIFLFEGRHGNYEREKHWHTSIEIFAVLKGRLTFFLNEEEYPLEAGGLIIINSDEIHSIHAPRKNETVVLQIPLKQFEKYFTASGLSDLAMQPVWQRIRSPRLRITGSWHFLLRSFIRCTVPVKKDGMYRTMACTTIFCT